MAGLIRVNKQKAWSVATWVFDHVLRVARGHLPTEGSARIVELIDNIAPGLNYLSLEDLSPEEMKIFRKALEDAYDEMLTTGRESFGDPYFYPGFMARFGELLEIVPAEPSKNHVLDESQRRKLCELIGRALVHIRLLARDGHCEQAADLADAFHALPTMLHSPLFRWDALEVFLESYHRRYPPAQPGDYFDFLWALRNIKGK